MAAAVTVVQARTVYVRPYEPTDLEAVRDVCFATGLMGEPIASQFGDRDTFAHLFCDWYLLNRPDTCWVVDDGGARNERGTAVGYLIASPDPPDEGRHHRRALSGHLLGRRVILRRDTVGFFGRAIADLARDRAALAPWDTERYPAEMHVNLLPQARGRGLGGELVGTLVGRLGELHVPGIHLGTFGENTAAIAFFESQGFRSVGDAVPNPGFRLADGSRATVRRFCRSLA
ncbi:MAG: GNAT family N-acetyltransferase [Microthrixaceae bacterium]